MYTDNRNSYRQAFYIAWEKYRKQLPLEALEAQIVDVIIQHPQYHAFLEKPNTLQDQEFALEENPFFHLSLHMAIRDQIKLNRPVGITGLYQQLRLTLSPQDAEHELMLCLMQLMTRGEMNDEQGYLKMIKERIVR